uniref:Secreted protein n=1 Tax=Physcomitrium patens TaxID=3218 RepID=A0A2K1IY62_PHYPA|nr:hypothetical protein PHYPA_024031 [Physcomitrium patens]
MNLSVLVQLGCQCVLAACFLRSSVQLYVDFSLRGVWRKILTDQRFRGTRLRHHVPLVESSKVNLL